MVVFTGLHVTQSPFLTPEVNLEYINIYEGLLQQEYVLVNAVFVKAYVK